MDISVRYLKNHLSEYVRGVQAGAGWPGHHHDLARQEFIRKISRLGIERGVSVRFDNIRGKGSHRRLHYGDRYTTVKDRKEELGRGLLAAMLKQLGLTHENIAG